MICPECENKTVIVDCKRRGKKALYRRYECTTVKGSFFSATAWGSKSLI